jgi:hypothetical protein
MPESAFLDKSVLLAFCFRTDPHHAICRNYLENEKDYYITEEIDDAFDRNRDRMTRDHADAIRLHIKDIRDSPHNGPLGSSDLRDIRENVLFDGNAVSEFLDRWYAGSVENGITVSELEDRLRYLSRDIERLAYKRKNEFDELVIMWIREDEYPDVADALSVMSAEDMFVCIDAHDLAVNLDSGTELATADESDFIENGRESLILDNTELDAIIGLSA